MLYFTSNIRFLTFVGAPELLLRFVLCFRPFRYHMYCFDRTLLCKVLTPSAFVHAIITSHH